MIPEEQLQKLLQQLTSHPKECEWIEFKQQFHSNEEIGQDISALSNGACLHKQQFGYLVFGVENNTHTIVGTSFKPSTHKKGNEEFENLLLQRLNPRIDVCIYEFIFEGKVISLFEIPAATHQPVDFSHDAYIRVGSISRKLREFPEKESKIWKNDSSLEFERGIASERATADEVVKLLDTQSFFEISKIPYPSNRDGVMERLSGEKLIIRKGAGYAITNVGAILFAKNLNDFERLGRKASRVIVYKGNNKTETIREQPGQRGYAISFRNLVAFINDQLPANEAIEKAIPKTLRMYPELAVRELVANALIHQDFSISGSGPMFEIYSDRIEFSNAGLPLITTIRFIDEYQSRNEKIASFMRRFGFCEEKGSGIDKVVNLCEVFQLPPPDFITQEKHTKAIMYAPSNLTSMNKSDRVRACYQHSCLKYVSNERMTNQTLRARFNIEEKNSAIASRIIKETINDNLIKDEDPKNTSKKYSRYVPFWA